MPPTRVAGHDQGPCRGDWLRPRPHASAAARKRATASSAYRGGVHGGAPFGDNASTRGRHLRAQRPRGPVRSLGQWCLSQRGSPVGKAVANEA
ncbi:hypothetical protein B296_00036174 [Ensete ventricosum]|uniref:Uncharacterized protein n=1 Tax=Ensete ventricosum TaxID=4639 RepID=A0A426X549_ENSVE|nr:hypothetical protein B296_00036174 [Ensete ventricosum]